MNSRERLFIISSVIFLISGIMIGADALAADAPAEMQISGNQVAWSPAIQFQEATLTVGLPDGSVFKRTFQPGDSLNFSILDAGDAQDGLYTWELTFSPVISSRDRDSMLRTDANAEAGAARRNDILPPAETLKGAGHFRVTGGSIVDSVAVEEPFLHPETAEKSGTSGQVDDRDVPTRDQVIIDDLIVDGSICVGFDCVNGESFGFDTIRLKENNIRIKADDTSTSASFPSTDWQLTFNDSANGGANKFSIDDITNARTPFTIIAGAPSNSIYVKNNGNVGFGTTTPVVDLHVVNGNTPALRLEQDGSAGFTAQTWDIAGNETNFFVRDVTNGSRLPFRIRPSAPTNSLYINMDGNVGFGTTSPNNPIHVQRSNSNAALQLDVTGSVAQSWTMRTQSSNGNLEIRNDTGTVTIPVRVGPGTNSNLLLVGLSDATTPDANRVSINGELFINGVDNSNPDYVFESTYELESIEDHAQYMWENKHLPAIGRGVNGQDGKATINVATRSQGMLEELEKAHIYIEALHKTIGELENRLQKLEKASE